MHSCGSTAAFGSFAKALLWDCSFALAAAIAAKSSAPGALGAVEQRSLVWKSPGAQIGHTDWFRQPHDLFGLFPSPALSSAKAVPGVWKLSPAALSSDWSIFKKTLTFGGTAEPWCGSSSAAATLRSSRALLRLRRSLRCHAGSLDLHRSGILHTKLKIATVERAPTKWASLLA